MAKAKLSEDWTATVVGLTIVAVALLVYSGTEQLLAPVHYKWSNLSELGDVFGAENSLLILGWLGVSWVVTTGNFVLQGKSWR